MSKFKKGQIIQAIVPGTGLEKATVLDTYTETKGRHKGKEMYRLKIMNGIATIPVSVEDNYQILK